MVNSQCECCDGDGWIYDFGVKDPCPECNADAGGFSLQSRAKIAYENRTGKSYHNSRCLGVVFVLVLDSLALIDGFRIMLSS